MKTNISKIISVFLALAVFVCCFTSCTIKKGDEEETSATKPSEIQKPDEDFVDFEEYTLPGDEDETNSETGDETETTANIVLTTKPSSNSGTTKPHSNNGNGNTENTTASGSSGLTKQDMVSLLKAAGYVYDAEQDIYYTHLNPWQRHFGFTGQYDAAASYFNMDYTTFKCDFTYKDKYWRIQCWKGQYALLCGAEMGVYTKDINSDLSDDFYACANDDNLLEMGFDFYKTTKDYNAGNRLFYRPLEYHWWQTGFKFGYANSKNCVVVMTLYAKDKAMADGIEKGLRNVRDANGKLNPFYKYGASVANGKVNLYQRTGNEFKIIWVTAGYENYTGNMI